MTHIFV